MEATMNDPRYMQGAIEHKTRTKKERRFLRRILATMVMLIVLPLGFILWQDSKADAYTMCKPIYVLKATPYSGTGFYFQFIGWRCWSY